MKKTLKVFIFLSAITLSNIIVYKYSSFKKDTEIKKYKQQQARRIVKSLKRSLNSVYGLKSTTSLNDKKDILKHIEDVSKEIKLYCKNDTQFKVDQVLKLEDEKINKLTKRLEIVEKYMKQGGID